MTRRPLALCFATALLTGCGSGNDKSARTNTPAPPPPNAAPDVPKSRTAKAKPPAPPRLTAPR